VIRKNRRRGKHHDHPESSLIIHRHGPYPGGDRDPFLSYRSGKTDSGAGRYGKDYASPSQGGLCGVLFPPSQKNINWELFKRWKSNRNPSITDRIARDFLPFIKNHYDLITTAPPSANRCPNRYCVYDLAKAISRMTGIPFIPAFSQKTDKVHHGRHASLNQSEPKLLESWNIRNRSILFVDDCITSGTTARLCYEALVARGNHVDGLIWISAG